MDGLIDWSANNSTGIIVINNNYWLMIVLIMVIKRIRWKEVIKDGRKFL